jgi:uncharacterized membrane protein YhaH (DUF805 family)
MGGMEPAQLFFLSLIVAAPFLGVALENSGKRLNRTHYIGWVVFAIIANGLANVFGKQGFGPMVGMALFVAGLFVYFLLAQKSVQRAREAGISKSLCFIVAVPLVGLLMVVFLMIKGPGAGQAPASVDDASEG